MNVIVCLLRFLVYRYRIYIISINCIPDIIVARVSLVISSILCIMYYVSANTLCINC
jgi:hypothetical protein